MIRMKSYDRVLTSPWEYTVSYAYGYSHTHSGNVLNIPASNFLDGEYNPSWREDIFMGRDATTPMVAKRFKFRSFIPTLVSAIGYNPYNPGSDYVSGLNGWLYAGFNPEVNPVLENEEDLTDRVLSQIIGDAKQIITPLQMGVVLGEVTKTLRMIRNPAASIRTAIDGYLRDVKKLSRKSSFWVKDASAYRKRRISLRGQQMLANQYLNFTYGVTPLMYDVQNALDLLDQYRMTRGFEVVGLKARAKSETGGKYTKSGNVGAVVVDEVNQYNKVSLVRIKAGIKVEPQGSLSTLPKDLGFKLRDFVPTVAELLPWSFLVGYFSSIRDIIDAWSLVDSRLAYAVKTTRVVHRERSFQTSVNPITYDNWPYIAQLSIIPGLTVWESKAVTRTRLQSLIPSLRMRLPGFGTKTALNVAGLIWAKTNSRLL